MVNEALKIQFSPSFMTPLTWPWHVIIKTHSQYFIFMQLGARDIGSHSKEPTVSTANNSFETSAKLSRKPVNTHSKVQKDKKGIQAQAAMIGQEEIEIEKLKSAQSIGMTTQQLVLAIT